jgi:uncharacterized protein YhhL (DUF1145 family)
MNTILKAGCLAVYVLAIISSRMAFPAGIGPTVQVIALVLLAAHTLELLVAFSAVKRHPGPLVDSIALTLLFGLLHWKPLTGKP